MDTEVDVEDGKDITRDTVTGDMAMEDTAKEDTDMDMIIMEVDPTMETGADMTSTTTTMEDTVVTVMTTTDTIRVNSRVTMVNLRRAAEVVVVDTIHTTDNHRLWPLSLKIGSLCCFVLFVTGSSFREREKSFHYPFDTHHFHFSFHM